MIVWYLPCAGGCVTGALTFLSEVHADLVAGDQVDLPLPATAKYYSVGIWFTDIDTYNNLIVIPKHAAPLDPCDERVGPMASLGVPVVIPDHCKDGAVPDTLLVINNTTPGSGKDLHYWVRFYK